jgi:hypothetical protein
MGRVDFERAIVGNSIGAFIGGMSGRYAPPDSFVGSMAHHSFYGVGAGLRHATKGAFSGIAGMGGLAAAAASGPFHAVGDYFKWRRAKGAQMNRARDLADFMERAFPGQSSLDPIFGGKEGAAFRQSYGRELNNSEIGKWDLRERLNRFIEGPYKPRKFGARKFSEHMVQGAKNYAKLMTSPTNLGVHIAFAGLMSNDNLLDPKDGFVKAFAESVAGEAGFMAGATIAPALISGALPGSFLLAGAGMIVGGFGGAIAASAIPGMVSDYSEWGNANGRRGRPFRSSLVNSEQAATMRQRGIQAIYRSQMNARSALGSEALSYHS